MVRWDGGAVDDAELVRKAADRGFHAVIFFGRDTLEQPELQGIASKFGLVLVAVDAKDPLDAKVRVLRNLSRLHKMLSHHTCLLTLAHRVREYSGA